MLVPTADAAAAAQASQPHDHELLTDALGPQMTDFVPVPGVMVMRADDGVGDQRAHQHAVPAPAPPTPWREFSALGQ